MDYIYTTGEMIDLISKDKELIFEAVSGMYDGGIIAFHEDQQMLMWKDYDTYLQVTLNNEFLKTKWRLLSTVCIFRVDLPLINVGKIYCYYK